MTGRRVNLPRRILVLNLQGDEVRVGTDRGIPSILQSYFRFSFVFLSCFSFVPFVSMRLLRPVLFSDAKS